MSAEMISPALITTLGFGLGAIFGAVGSRTNFCTLGAISDALNIGSFTRLRMWVMAIAVAILGVWGLQTLGLLDTSKSLYGSQRLPWLSHITGGLLFGAGMVLASGCTSKALIRIGGGNLKSWVVFLVLGLSAYMTLKGLFGVWRVNTVDRFVIEFATPQDLASLLATLTGVSAASLSRWLAPLIGAVLLLYSLSDREVWSQRREPLLGGIVTGLVVVGAWYVTGHLGHLEEHPETLEEAFIATQGNRPESLSLVAPYAYTLELLMFWSDTSRHLTFGIATALGVVAGAFVHARAAGEWHEEIFPDGADFKRHVAGAVLMGVGGVTALGCTIGQGLSGLSTLSLGAVLSTLAIAAGAVATMKFEYWRMMRETG